MARKAGQNRKGVSRVVKISLSHTKAAEHNFQVSFLSNFFFFFFFGVGISAVGGGGGVQISRFELESVPSWNWSDCNALSERQL